MNKGVKISELPVAVEIPDGSLLPAVVDGTTSAVDIETLKARVQTDLTNYYTKAETNELVSKIPKFAIEVVDTLPTENISNTTVYLLKSSEEALNLYTEYIYVNEAWEELGAQTVDLSDYYTKTETDAAIQEAIAESGGGGAKLYEEYGENTDGALTQKFVTFKLFEAKVELGREAVASNNFGIAIGESANGAGNWSTAIGSGAKAAGSESVAIGHGASATNTTSLAIGKSVGASGSNAIAIGNSLSAGGRAAISMGTNSSGAGERAVVLGGWAHATKRDSVAVGSFSTTSRNNEVSIGDPSNADVPTRFLANVKAGELDTDAVNLKQLNDAVAGLQAQIDELKGNQAV